MRKKPHPNRRQLIQAGFASGIGAALFCGNHPLHADPVKPASLADLEPAMQAVQQSLRKLAGEWTIQNQLARNDGYVYSVDVAQLMICFAQAGDAKNYSVLRRHAVFNLIHDEPTDSYTRGFVSWRYKPGEKLDASGTTEALRLARALWLGSAAFHEPRDADLAASVLSGYARHATVDQGVWIIRNYFGFATRAFATNSFLVDYDADFVREVADATKNPEFAKLAENSCAAVQKAVAPCGLLYDLLQPELKTLYPELDVVAFSPNDIIQFSNCCTTATTLAKSLPNVARRVLAFALNRLSDLRIYYYGRSGQPVNDRAAGLFELSSLARLAVLLGDTPAAASIAQIALPQWKYFSEHADATRSYLVSEILMALAALLGH